MVDEQISELQTKVAFQEDTIEQLNQALADQQQQIELLEYKLKHVIDKLKQLEPASVGSEGDEPPPPHY